MTKDMGNLASKAASEIEPPIDAITLENGAALTPPEHSTSEACEKCGAVLPGIDIASWWLEARRLRESVFGAEMFSDPAWDILLCLYVEAARGAKIKITSLSPMTGLAITTAGRWARKMVAGGLLIRERDERDLRRFFLSLSTEGYALVKRYFEELLVKGNLPKQQQS